MTCYYPVHGWQSAKPNEKTGKYPLTFNIREAYVDKPMTVPCGKCTGCRSDQAMAWSIRAYHESTQHLLNSFITLTYDEQHLPADRKIDPAELQKFFKRARKTGYKLRYIACGEYGEQTRRPHYHAIIFGQDFADDKITIDDNLYTSPTLEKLWGKGNVSIAPADLGSIFYVCGYTQKKIGDPDTFSLSSRRPPIGNTWLNNHIDDLERTGIITIDGREFQIPPAYFRRKEHELEHIKEQRREYAKNTPIDYTKLAAREINAKAQIKQKKETL